MGLIVSPPYLAIGGPSHSGETRSTMRPLLEDVMPSKNTSPVRPGMKGLLAGE